MYLSILGVDTRQVDLRRELDLGRRIRVVRAAMNRNAVDAVLVNTLRLHDQYTVAKITSDHVHEEGQGLCRSSLTSRGRRHCQVRRSMPLFTLSVCFCAKYCSLPYQHRDPSRPSQAPPAGESCVVLWRPCLLLSGCAVKVVMKWDVLPRYRVGRGRCRARMRRRFVVWGDWSKIVDLMLRS